MAIRSVIFDIIGRDNASKAFLSASASAEASAKRMSAAMATMTKASAAMTKAVTVPVIALAAVSVEQAAKFQKSMTLLETAGGEASSKMGAISKGIEDIAKSTGTNLDALGQGAYVVAKAFSRNPAADQLKILKAAAQGAKAENVDLGTAVQALTSVMSSYGMKAGQAVAAENEIIRASGLAKTSQQDFAASLSSVIPIASSLGISMAQVGGAIATMTQHGETAQQATDNLANLITNLAGQNNIASAAMQQLGIDTIDLQQNLGKRGLTGTLDIVESALARNSHGGMVVVDAFKNAQKATGSLDTMLQHFTGNLLVQSKGLLAGTTSVAEYRKTVRGMGGDAAASGLNFLALYQQTNGFNNALKSGNGDVSTAAATLQKMLGGVTGLRVALQLGGASAGYFKTAVDKIGQAAQQAGTDVLGWNKTNSTFAVKLDEAKASLQVLAVQIGTALIPAVLKVVHGITTFVHWLDALGPSAKHFLGTTVAILAIVGPLVLVITKLYGAIKSLVTFMIGAAVASSRFVKGLLLMEVSTAAYGSTAFAAGFRIRAAFSAIFLSAKNMVTGVVAAFTEARAASLAASAESGAAGIGSRFAAVGAGAAAATTAIAPLALGILGVTAVVAGGIALWDHYKDKQREAAAQAAATAQTIGDLSTAIQNDNDILGANTRAYLANKIATEGDVKLLSQVQGLGATFDKNFNKVGGLSLKTTDLLDAVLGNKNGLAVMQKLFSAQGVESSIGLSNTSLDTLVKNLEALGADTGSAMNHVKDMNSILGTQTPAAANAAASGTDKLSASLDKINASLSLPTTIASFNKAFDNLSSSVSKTDHSLTGTSKAAEHNKAAVLGAAQSILTLAQAQQAAGVSATTIATDMLKNVDALITFAKSAHLSTAEVDALLTAMGLTPKQIDTYFNVNIQDALAKIAALQAALAAVTDGADGRGRAATNEAISIANQIHALQKSLTQTSATSSSSSRGTNIVGGSGVGSGGSASSAATKHADLVKALQAAASALVSASASSATTGADMLSAVQALNLAAKALGLSSTKLTAAVGKQENALVNDARARDAIQAKLGTPTSTSVTAYDRLAAARTSLTDEYTGVRNSITGSFSIATAGVSQYTDQPGVSSTSILFQITTAANNAKKFASTLTALAKGGLNKTLLAQLAEAGPAALPQALALMAATPGQISGINSQYTALSASAASAGSFIAHDLYDTGVNAAQGIVNGLLSQESKLNAAIKKLGEAMIATLDKTLGIHSPSTVFRYRGHMSAEGYALGWADRRDHIDRSISSSVDPSSAGGSGARRGNGHTSNFYITTQDPIGVAHAVERRQQMRARA